MSVPPRTPTSTRAPPSRNAAPPEAPGQGWRPTRYARLGRPVLRVALLALAAAPAFALALPIAAVNALAFGPRRVLFLQLRIGCHGRPFRIVKFRTMHGEDGAGPDAARVTRFGRFLRSTHLDELPQLWNVLRGEMDLIGPRPEMVAIDMWARARIPGFRERNAVLPGLTGLAQVTQGYVERDEYAYRLKLQLDRRYLARFSFAQDLAILAATCNRVLRGRGWATRRPSGMDVRAPATLRPLPRVLAAPVARRERR